MVKQGAVSKELLSEMYHKIDKLFEFEIFVHNNIIDWIIIVNTKKDIYAWSDDNIFIIISNEDDYVWYKFR